MGNMSYCRFQNTLRDLQAVAAQFHGHRLEVEARRDTFEALVMPWVAYEKARAKDRRML